MSDDQQITDNLCYILMLVLRKESVWRSVERST